MPARLTDSNLSGSGASRAKSCSNLARVMFFFLRDWNSYHDVVFARGSVGTLFIAWNHVTPKFDIFLWCSIDFSRIFAKPLEYHQILEGFRKTASVQREKNRIFVWHDFGQYTMSWRSLSWKPHCDNCSSLAEKKYDPCRIFSNLTPGIVGIWAILNSFWWILGPVIDKIHEVSIWTKQSTTSACKHCLGVKQCFQDSFNIVL